MRRYFKIFKTVILAILLLWVASIVVSSTSYSEEVIVGIDYINSTKSKLNSSAINFWKMIGCDEAKIDTKSYEDKICTTGYPGTISLKNWNKSIIYAESINPDTQINYEMTKNFYIELKNYIERLNWDSLTDDLEKLDKKIKDEDIRKLFETDEEKKKLKEIEELIKKIKDDQKDKNDKDYIKDEEDLKTAITELDKLIQEKQKEKTCKDLLDQIKELLKLPTISDETKQKISKLNEEIGKLNDKECSEKAKKLEEQLNDIILNELKKIFEELKNNLDASGDLIHIIIGKDSFAGDYETLKASINYTTVGYDDNGGKECLKYNSSLHKIEGFKSSQQLCLIDIVAKKKELKGDDLKKWIEYCTDINQKVQNNINNLKQYIDKEQKKCNPEPTSVTWEWFNYDQHTKNPPPKHTTRRNAYDEYKKYVDDIFNKDPKVQKSKSTLKTNCENVMSLEKEVLCCQTLDCIALEKYVLEIEADKTLSQTFRDDVRTKFNNVEKNNSSCNDLKSELEVLVKKSKEDEEKKQQEKEKMQNEIENLIANQSICSFANNAQITGKTNEYGYYESYILPFPKNKLNTEQQTSVENFITIICHACQKYKLTHLKIKKLAEDIISKKENLPQKCSTLKHDLNLLNTWDIAIHIFKKPKLKIKTYKTISPDICRTSCKLFCEYKPKSEYSDNINCDNK